MAITYPVFQRNADSYSLMIRGEAVVVMSHTDLLSLLRSGMQFIDGIQNIHVPGMPAVVRLVITYDDVSGSQHTPTYTDFFAFETPEDATRFAGWLTTIVSRRIHFDRRPFINWDRPAVPEAYASHLPGIDTVREACVRFYATMLEKFSEYLEGDWSVGVPPAALREIRKLIRDELAAEIHLDFRIEQAEALFPE